MLCIKLPNDSYLDRFGGAGDLHACRSFTDATLCAILAKSAGGIVCDEGLERARRSSNAVCRASVWDYAILPVVTDWSNWAVGILAVNGLFTMIDIIHLLNTRIQ